MDQRTRKMKIMHKVLHSRDDRLLGRGLSSTDDCRDVTIQLLEVYTTDLQHSSRTLEEKRLILEEAIIKDTMVKRRNQ